MLIIYIFLFYRQRKNIIHGNEEKQSYVQLEFPPIPVSKTYFKFSGCDFKKLFVPFDKNLEFCLAFSNHGHCAEGSQCEKSHDVDQLVLCQGMN